MDIPLCRRPHLLAWPASVDCLAFGLHSIGSRNFGSPRFATHHFSSPTSSIGRPEGNRQYNKQKTIGTGMHFGSVSRGGRVVMW